MLLGSKQMDAGHILENVVYLELLRRGYDVYVGKINEFEVDFVAQNSRGTSYFQVALTVRDEKTLQRELRPLQSIRDHYPKMILTLDEDPETQYDGISRVNASSEVCKICKKLKKFLRPISNISDKFIYC